jgi:UDP-N-acetylmuramyl pentapeptide phosphotransferase/UDP-N-acetylglucosamine-1-phosphate transferase
MLILAKSAMAMMLGFILALITGLILLPVLKKLKMKQKPRTREKKLRTKK